VKHKFPICRKRISRFQTEFQTVLCVGDGYFMPDGSVGMLTRVDIDARMDTKPATGLNGWKKLAGTFTSGWHPIQIEM
jgi:hypothetical protein